MDSQFRLFSNLSLKLGLNSENTVRKGRELHRLLQLKLSTCHLNISGTCQIIICLDLAAAALGLPFEKADAIKLSGVTKKNYTSFHHTIEKLLGIEKSVAIKDLCVQFGVNEACFLATKIFEKYANDAAHRIVADLTHPMYNVAAVFAACKQLKLKANRAKLMELSHIKKSSFIKLATTFEKYADEMNSGSKIVAEDDTDVCKPESLMKHIEDLERRLDDFSPAPSVDKTQSYEDWKRSILEECEITDT